MVPSPWKRRTSNNGLQGPTYMSEQRMSDYLNDLRSSRIPRPNGSRPLPETSVRRSSTWRSNSNTFVSAKSRYSYGPSDDQSIFQSASGVFRRTVSETSNTSLDAASDKTETWGCNNDPARQMEREEAHQVRVTLDQLDLQEEQKPLRKEQRYILPIEQADARNKLDSRDSDENRDILTDQDMMNPARVARSDNRETSYLTSSDAEQQVHDCFSNDTVDTQLAALDASENLLSPNAASSTRERNVEIRLGTGLAFGPRTKPPGLQMCTVNKQRLQESRKIPERHLTHIKDRRRSSGSRRPSGNRGKSLFANPEDRIFEDHTVVAHTNVEALRYQQYPVSLPEPKENAASQIVQCWSPEKDRSRRNPFDRARSFKSSLPNSNTISKEKGKMFEKAISQRKLPETSLVLPSVTVSQIDGQYQVYRASSGESGVVGTGTSLSCRPWPEDSKGNFSKNTNCPNVGSSSEDVIPRQAIRSSRLFHSDPNVPRQPNTDGGLVPQPLRPRRSRVGMKPSDPTRDSPAQDFLHTPLVVCPGIIATERVPANGSDIPPFSAALVPPLLHVEGSQMLSQEDVSLAEFPVTSSTTLSTVSPGAASTKESNDVSHFARLAESATNFAVQNIDDIGRPKISPLSNSLQSNGRTSVHTWELCNSCALPISGRSITVSSVRFHPACFLCYHCEAALECVAFYPEPDLHRSARLERNQQQVPDELGFGNGRFTLTTDCIRGSNQQENGDKSLRFYCHLDFHELFSPRCKSCKTPIEGEVIVACNAEWHEGHFFCTQCGEPFNANTPFVEKDGYAWCVECHLNRFSPKCKKCRKPVTDVVVRAYDGEWHEHCFGCMVCKAPIKDGGYFLREDGKVIVCSTCETKRLKGECEL